MAEKDNTTGNGINFGIWPIDSLVSHVDKLVDEINEVSNKIAAVAYGGEAWASGPDGRGDPIEPISAGMFGAIVSMSESAALYHQLKDAIAELSARTHALQKGGA